MTDYELGEKRVDWVFAHMPVMQRLRAMRDRVALGRLGAGSAVTRKQYVPIRTHKRLGR